jgi:hypothetical protein
MVFSLNSSTTFLNRLPAFVYFLIAVMVLSLNSLTTFLHRLPTFVYFLIAVMVLSLNSSTTFLHRLPTFVMRLRRLMPKSISDRENSFIRRTNRADSQYESYLPLLGCLDQNTSQETIVFENALHYFLPWLPGSSLHDNMR